MSSLKYFFPNIFSETLYSINIFLAIELNVIFFNGNSINCISDNKLGRFMHIKADTLDDLLIDVFNDLIESGKQDKSTKGKYFEFTGVLLELTNPLARLSRSEIKGTVFSCLGELIWYLSGSNNANFITYYIKFYKNFVESDNTIHGGYGPRLSQMHGAHDQIENVINILRLKPTTRQAVIQLFDAADISIQKLDTPCTISLQFILRDNQLHMFTNMRSNDVFKGLPHDVFVFTMLQEIIASRLNCQVGSYKHFVGSLHLYLEDKGAAANYIAEGFHSSNKIMTPMPRHDLQKDLVTLIECEDLIRNNKELEIENIDIDTYWKDFIRLLKIFQLFKEATVDVASIYNIQKNIINRAYLPFITKKISKIKR